MLKFCVFILLSILSLTSAANTCAQPCNGHPLTAYYATNPRGCAWYFTCNVGQPPVQGRCPDGFLFNHKDQLCDHPENVECRDPEPITSCPAKGIAKISHPDTCSKYICEYFFCNLLKIN